GRHFVGQRAGHDHHIRLSRRRPRRETEAFRVVARHRHLHHLDRAAGEPEGHPHQRASTRPDDEIGARGDQETLVRKLPVHADEASVVRAHGLAGARIKNALDGPTTDGPALYSPSTPPFPPSYMKPT